MFAQSLVNGIVTGLVVDLDDPDKLGRIKVKYPILGDEVQHWARLVSPMAGAERGMRFRPEVEDEVLLAFEMGCPDRPYVLGALWSSVDKPPLLADEPEPQDNNWRLIRTRSGHLLKFDDKDKETAIELTTAGGHALRLSDKDGEERIELVDSTNKHKLVLDTKNKKLQVLAQEAGDVIEVKAPAGELQIETQNKIAVTCKQGDIAVKAPVGTLSVEALQVEVKAQTTLSLEAGASVDIKATGPVNIQGALVNLN